MLSTSQQPPGQTGRSAAAAATLAAHEECHLRAAARHATRVFPGAIGELLARELCAHADFGMRSADSGLLRNVAREMLTMPVARDAPRAHSAIALQPGRFPR